MSPGGDTTGAGAATSPIGSGGNPGGESGWAADGTGGQSSGAGEPGVGNPAAGPAGPIDVTAAAQAGSGEPGPGGQGSGGVDNAGRGTGSEATSGNASPAELEALGLSGGIPLPARMAVSAVVTTGTVTLAMAFVLFGKRRRDGEQPAADEVLAAAAGTMARPVPASTLVSMTPAPAIVERDAEADLPRWRRPSLLAARKADPLRSVTSATALSFDHGAVGPIDGHERRRIRYRLVRLLDAPDELRGSETGFLDQGDEVQLIERSGAYWLVLCPDGSRGWIHKMTLAEREEPAVEGTLDDERVDDDVRDGSTGGVFAADNIVRFQPRQPSEGWPAPEPLHEPESIDADVLEAFLRARRAL